MKHILLFIACLCLLSPITLVAKEFPITFRESLKVVSMSIGLPKDTSYTLIQRNGITTITIRSPRTVNLKVLKNILPKGFSIKHIIPKSTSPILQLATPGFRVKNHVRKEHGILVEYVPDKSIAVTSNRSPTPRTKPVAAGKSGLAVKTAAAGSTTQPVGRLEIKSTPKESNLIFSFPEERSLVAFLRDEHYVFVFNHPHPMEIKGTLLRSHGKLEQRLDFPMIIFELKRSPEILAQITKEENKWIITLGKNLHMNQKSVRRDLKGKLKYSESREPIYEIDVAHSNIEYSFIDPRHGDRLLLVPLRESDKRFDAGVKFSDFQILSSHQGIAIQTYTPDLKLNLGDQKITLQRPGGLQVSSRHDREQAYLAEKNEQIDKTEILLTRVANHPDGKTSALAEIELIHQKLVRAAIDLPEAIKKMEALRYSWHNSEMEWKILKDLSQLYIDNHNYKNALSTMAVALKYYPEAPDYNEVRTKMVETFKILFSDENKQNISPVTVVSLFESFKSLTPSGPDGDDIVIGLAHNLERLDLPKQAATALKSRYQASDFPHPRLALEYAIALLASNQSDKVLKVVDKAEKQKLTAEERDKLLYVKVKALANLGQYTLALQLIQSDKSNIAEKVRAGLYWKSANWRKAADSLWVLLDKQKDKDPELLMHYALMLYKAKDFKRAKAIKKKYSGLMKNTKYKEPFGILTSHDFENNIKLDQLELHLAQVDEFEKLLDAAQK